MDMDRTKLQEIDLIFKNGISQLRNMSVLCASSDLGRTQVKSIISDILNEKKLNRNKDGK